MKIKALIFDVDGTLADTEEAHRRSFNLAFERHGLAWHWSEDEYGRLLKTTGGKERMGIYVDSLAIDAPERSALKAQIPAIHRTKTDNYTQMVGEGLVPLRDGVGHLIEEAKHAGVRLSIATTTSLANIEALLSANLGRDALADFSVIGAAEQAQRKKPAPDVFEYVLEELHECAADCVAIEDSANGLAAAKAAGLFTVITPSPWTRGENFEDADLIMSSLGTSPHPLRDIENSFNLARDWGRRTHSTAMGEQ
jgi:beta-phosphoglucomutase-like phosphatase (HAD superfamily)